MTRGLNLNHLSTLIAVADAKGFRAAAERLHITQSAVSAQIRTLEQRLGVPLLHRTTRSVELSEEGRRLYAVARRMNTEMAQVVEDLRAGAALERGRVEIASTGSIAAALLPRLIVAFGARYPGIVFKVQDVDSTRVLQLVQRDEVDFGILSSLGQKRGVKIEPLFRDEFVVVAPSSGHAFSKRSKVSLAEVGQMALLLNPRGAVLRDMVDRAFARAGLATEPAHEAFSGLTLVAMVGEGLGVTILPSLSLVGLDLSKCRVLRFRERIDRQIVIARPSGRAPSSATTAFLQFLKEQEINGRTSAG